MSTRDVFGYKKILGIESRGICPILLCLCDSKTRQKYVELVHSPARTYWAIDLDKSDKDSKLFKFFMNKNLPKDFSKNPIMTDKMLADNLKEYKSK